MKLKCIGGKCDGQSINVEDARYRQGEAVRVDDYPKIIADFKRFEPEPVVVSNIEIYIVDILRYHDGKKN